MSSTVLPKGSRNSSGGFRRFSAQLRSSSMEVPGSGVPPGEPRGDTLGEVLGEVRGEKSGRASGNSSIWESSSSASAIQLESVELGDPGGGDMDTVILCFDMTSLASTQAAEKRLGCLGGLGDIKDVLSMHWHGLVGRLLPPGKSFKVLSGLGTKLLDLCLLGLPLYCCGSSGPSSSQMFCCLLRSPKRLPPLFALALYSSNSSSNFSGGGMLHFWWWGQQFVVTASGSTHELPGIRFPNTMPSVAPPIPIPAPIPIVRPLTLSPPALWNAVPTPAAQSVPLAPDSLCWLFRVFVTASVIEPTFWFKAGVVTVALDAMLVSAFSSGGFWAGGGVATHWLLLISLPSFIIRTPIFDCSSGSESLWIICPEPKCHSSLYRRTPNQTPHNLRRECFQTIQQNQKVPKLWHFFTLLPCSSVPLVVSERVFRRHVTWLIMEIKDSFATSIRCSSCSYQLRTAIASTAHRLTFTCVR